MKIRILLAVLVIGAVVYPPLLSLGSQLEKITICHATGSEQNPYVEIHTSPNSTNGHFDNEGTPNEGHEDDLLFEGDVDCPEGEGGGGGGGGGGEEECDVPTSITGFDVQNATMNDNTLEMVWDEESTDATSINVRYGYEDGVWLFTTTSTNDGFEAIGGLTNGVHYWFSLQAVNDCGEGDWTGSVDPLP